MILSSERPVANGLRTDHPIPDLPFVDDRHIPIEDPHAVEAVGRGTADDMWGREDRTSDGGWKAFTTDPQRHDVAWVVRFHPERGRSVVLYRDEDVSSRHSALPDALLFRAGGYWWDGAAWFRPPQVWDWAGEKYLRRQVSAARTVSAADFLSGGGDPRKGGLLSVTEVDIAGSPASTTNWLDDLARWARENKLTSQSLARSVVTLSAPELAANQLVGVSEAAGMAGISASTLRAYIARDEAGVPLPQAVVDGRKAWSRAVIAEWVERRRNENPGGSGPDEDGGLTRGQKELSKKFGELFFSRLWQNPERRGRWALRSRRAASVREVADDLSLDVAVNANWFVSVGDLAITLRHAVLGEFAAGQRLDRSLARQTSTIEPGDFFGIAPSVARLVGWLIEFDPTLAAQLLGDIVGEAERDLGITRKTSVWSLRTAVLLDRRGDTDYLKTFLDDAMRPILEGG